MRWWAGEAVNNKRMHGWQQQQEDQQQDQQQVTARVRPEKERERRARGATNEDVMAI